MPGMDHRSLKRLRRHQTCFQRIVLALFFTCVCVVWKALRRYPVCDKVDTSGTPFDKGKHSLVDAEGEEYGVSLNVQIDDETPLEYLPMLIRTPFSGDIVDRHKVVDAECPRYVTMPKQENGLGHQLGTYTTALITSLFFNLTFVDSPFIDKSVHGNYPGIADFTGLQHDELVLQDVIDKVDKVIEVTNMPVTPTSTDLAELYAPLMTTFNETYGTACNILFQLREYYSYDYGSFTKRIMAQKFRDAPHREPIQTVYTDHTFIVAVHVRTGDIDPTAESFFVSVLTQIVPYLEDVPYQIHVFAEGKGSQDYPRITTTAPRGRVVFHPNIPPFDTFYHLTQAHIFIMSASGFSQFAALLATKPLVFSPPSRESFPLKFCPPYAVCCDKHGRLDMEGILRLHRRKERWLGSHKDRNKTNRQ